MKTARKIQTSICLEIGREAYFGIVRFYTVASFIWEFRVPFEEYPGHCFSFLVNTAEVDL